MALKAEVPLLNYLKVSLKCKREEEKEKRVAEPLRPGRTSQEPDGARADPAEREWPVSNSVAQEEPSGSWQEEFLIAKGTGHRRPVCMVCGDVLSASGPATARDHILRQHPHSLDFSMEEKRNILEAWNEESEAGLPPSPEAALLSGRKDCRGREQARLCVSDRQSLPTDQPGRGKKPAEIEVLLDSEERPTGRKRGHLKARCEPTRVESRERSQSQQRRLNMASSKDTKLKADNTCTGKVWSSEGGLPGSAPAEIRIFTDGSFPAGFALKLYCRAQPERSQDSRPDPDTRKDRVDRRCSVSLMRLHSADSSRHLCPSQATTPCSLGGNDKDYRAKVAPASKKDPSTLNKNFNPSWRARFLMDYDPGAGQLLCMVCESPIRRICLATVKRHILQCHAETLHLPREVRRTIREVWETRAQSPSQAARK